MSAAHKIDATGYYQTCGADLAQIIEENRECVVGGNVTAISHIAARRGAVSVLARTTKTDGESA